jgi:hypothetical protein
MPVSCQSLVSALKDIPKIDGLLTSTVVAGVDYAECGGNVLFLGSVVDCFPLSPLILVNSEPYPISYACYIAVGILLYKSSGGQEMESRCIACSQLHLQLPT